VKRRARRCLGVDIGSTSLKVAELSQDRSGVLIQRLLEAPLDITPDASAEARWEAVTRALRDLLRENKVGTRQGVFALPAHTVFVRRVRLPKTTEERMERIIRFEARQQIPFPLDQTIIQYQIAPSDVEDEVEVLLVAIKREIVENYMALIRRLGLRPIQLGVSSFALFNFHMFDQGVEPKEFSLEEPVRKKTEETEETTEEEKPEKPKKPKKAGRGLKGLFKRKAKKAKEGAEEEPAEEEEAVPEEPVGMPEIEEIKAYLNIGASTMDLAIGRGGGSQLIGFARSIPIAGNQLTRIIQERLGCESFDEAERIKRERTEVLLGESPSDPEKYDEQACRAIMPVIDRMVAEIRRSLDFYISQPDGMAVDRLVLSGGQSALPNLPEYLEDRLGIPVEIAREIHNPACRSNIKAEVEITNFLPCLGLAVQGLGAACVTIDFLPEHLKGWIEFKRKNVQLVAQLALIGGMIFIATQTGNRMAVLWEQQARDMEMVMQRSKPLQERYTTAQTKRQVLSGLVYILKRSNGLLPDYGLDRNYFLKVLSLIQSVRPADVFFREIYIGPNGELVIDGYAEQPKSVPLLTEALNSAKEIESASLTRSPTPERPPGGLSRGTLYRFQITAKVKGKHSRIVPTPTPRTRYGREGWGRRRPPVRPGVRPVPQRPRPGAPAPRPADEES